MHSNFIMWYEILLVDSLISYRNIFSNVSLPAWLRAFNNTKCRVSMLLGDQLNLMLQRSSNKNIFVEVHIFIVHVSIYNRALYNHLLI